MSICSEYKPIRENCTDQENYYTFILEFQINYPQLFLAALQK